MLNEIIKRAKLHGKTLIYNATDELLIIDFCEKKQLSILGIDSFIISKNATQPIDEIDFTSDSFINSNQYNNSWEHARQFIYSHKENDLYYEITFSDNQKKEQELG